MADAPAIYFEKAVFRSNIILADSMSLSWTTEKLFSFTFHNTRKIFKNSTYLPFWGKALGGYRHVLYIFRKLFSRATFASLIVCLYLQVLKSYKASKLTTLKKYSTRNLAIANRLCISGVHNTSSTSIIIRWRWNLGYRSLKVTGNGTIW